MDEKCPRAGLVAWPTDLQPSYQCATATNLLATLWRTHTKHFTWVIRAEPSCIKMKSQTRISSSLKSKNYPSLPHWYHKHKWYDKKSTTLSTIAAKHHSFLQLPPYHFHTKHKNNSIHSYTHTKRVHMHWNWREQILFYGCTHFSPLPYQIISQNFSLHLFSFPAQRLVFKVILRKHI